MSFLIDLFAPVSSQCMCPFNSLLLALAADSASPYAT